MFKPCLTLYEPIDQRLLRTVSTCQYPGEKWEYLSIFLIHEGYRLNNRILLLFTPVLNETTSSRITNFFSSQEEKRLIITRWNASTVHLPFSFLDILKFRNIPSFCLNGLKSYCLVIMGQISTDAIFACCENHWLHLEDTFTVAFDNALLANYIIIKWYFNFRKNVNSQICD